MKADDEKEPMRVPMTEARANLSEMVAQARYLKRPIILTSRDKDIAMIVSMDFYDEAMRKFLEG